MLLWQSHNIDLSSLGPPGRLVKDEYSGGVIGPGLPVIDAGPAQTVQHPPQEAGYPQLMSGTLKHYLARFIFCFIVPVYKSGFNWLISLHSSYWGLSFESWSHLLQVMLSGFTILSCFYQDYQLSDFNLCTSVYFVQHLWRGSIRTVYISEYKPRNLFLFLINQYMPKFIIRLKKNYIGHVRWCVMFVFQCCC